MSVKDLHSAIQMLNMKCVADILNSDPDVNCACFQETALTRAVRGKLDEIINILEYPHTDINVGNQFDRTPLYFASSNCQVKLVDDLLEKGSDENCSDVAGVTPLGVSAYYDHWKTSEILIRAGEGGDEKKPDKLFEKLEAYCNPRKNEVLESHRFWMVPYQEPFDNFLTELRTRANSCNFQEKGRLTQSIKLHTMVSSKRKLTNLKVKDPKLDTLNHRVKLLTTHKLTTKNVISVATNMKGKMKYVQHGEKHAMLVKVETILNLNASKYTQSAQHKVTKKKMTVG
ncbi:unnamed protein product [Mytilus coruscus]|uniref:Uncharacterized protein n=1 Tax=Mytilus coruscus TaxID=42192 RepID=A0A6J8A2C5_MYTCO|nr:unnamed protein product [Mytilus coruscus]